MINTISYLKTAGLASFAALSGYLIAKDQISDKNPPLTLEQDSRPIVREGGTHPTSYAPMLENAQKFVVSVHTSETVRTFQGGQSQDDLLRRFFGMPSPRRNAPQPKVQEELRPQGIGSGVIVSPDGYILTNNHVVMDEQGGDADQILVKLSNGKELEAKLVGRDPKTDIAVLKVDETNLPAAQLADSDQIAVGDIVFAIGNPLGVGLTVTSGIISATGRSIGIYEREGGYENFIQTDAAINRGNSGGALVDIEGRLIGVNSAIVSNSGGSIGIGFAIPTNLAASIAEQLTTSGEVRRGVIGVRISELNSELSDALELGETKGVLVENVEEGLPAAKAGIIHGDVITAIDEKPIESVRQLRLAVSRVAPGTSIKVDFIRNGKKKTLEIEIADPSSAGMASLGTLIDGVTLLPVDDELRQQFSLPERVSGLVVEQVAADSPYARHLAPGTVILEVNKRSIRTLEDAQKNINPSGRNLLYLYHRGRTHFLVLDMRK